MWELDYKESWVLKNFCFWTVVLKKTLESPLDCKAIQPGDPSILKEISLGCSLKGLMLKLKLQYFGHLIGRINSCEKTLMLGKIEGRRRRGWQRMKWLDGITDSPTRWTWVWVNSGSWWWTGRPGVLSFMGSQRVRHNWVTEMNWTELMHLSRASYRSFQWHQWHIFLNWEVFTFLATKSYGEKKVFLPNGNLKLLYWSTGFLFFFF